MKSVQTFGVRLRRMLDRKNMTQTDLAEKIGTTSASLSRYVTDQRTPRMDVAIKIADALDTTVDYLYGRTDNPYKDVTAAASIATPEGYDSLSDAQKEQIQNLIDLFNDK